MPLHFIFIQKEPSVCYYPDSSYPLNSIVYVTLKVHLHYFLTLQQLGYNDTIDWNGIRFAQGAFWRSGFS